MAANEEKPLIHTFIFPPRIEFGVGAVKNLGKWVQDFKATTPFVVTDEGVVKAGLLEDVQKSLDDAALKYEVFDNVQPNPLDQNVNEGAALYQKGKHDLIIALGGGSPIDAAKGIQMIASAGGMVDKYFVGNDPPQITPHVKLIAIPTTAGTGSEVGSGAVITETKINQKRVVRSGFPALAIIDPALMKTMPPALTAATGMDALCHCIEGFVSKNYNPIIDGVALEGMRMIGENLRQAVKDGNDMEARTNMAMASTLGGLSMRKSLGVIHSISHQLSTQKDMPHGLANALMLPMGMEFNLKVATDKFARIAYALGVDTSSMSMDASAIAAIEAVRQLSKDISLPQTLRELGVTGEDIPIMAKNAMLDWCYHSNPRLCSEEDMLQLYQNAF